MIQKNLQEISYWVDGDLAVKDSGMRIIKGISTDNRNIKEGSLFIPIVGERFNGHDFVQKAIDQGAGASLWSRDQPDPPAGVELIFVEDTLLALQHLATAYIRTLNAKVVAITGSNGKTTTKDMMASVLSTTYKVQKTEGNFNNHIGLPLTILNLDTDTEMVVLEMGMSGFGEIELLSEIAEPDAAIVTNIGESHLQDLGSRDNISKAKMEITAGMKNGSPLIIHGDEPLLTDKADKRRFQVITFGGKNNNDYIPTEVIQEINETRFIIHDNESQLYSIPVPGKHNVMNALAVIAVAKSFGIKDESIQKGLARIKITGMRLERSTTPNGLTIINDAYNASPTSMKAAIEFTQDLEGFENKYVVLGDMLELGSEEIKYHTETGKAIDPAFFQSVFTFGGLAKHISEGAKTRFFDEHVRHFEEKDTLIQHLKTITKKGDLLLVKGSRGMKLEEVVKALMEG